MKADIFQKFCSWIFDILFELEKRIDMTKYTQQQYRALGTMGERLVGIYVLWLEKQNKYKIKYTPLLFFKNTARERDILPVFKKNNIPIVSNFNNQYAAIFGVFLNSVIRHSSDTHNYDFIILSNDISKRNKELLTSMLRKNMSIRFIPYGKYLSGLDLKIRHSVYTSDLYCRVIVPQILSAYDKLIVVDADMICQEDIANLYYENVDNYLCAGCIDSVFQGYLNGVDPSSLPYAINYMKMQNPYHYINTGLLLFNAKKYRQIYSISSLKRFIAQHVSRVKIYEQDMLNMLLKGGIKFLNPKWNCYTKSNDFIIKCFSLSPFETYQKYIEARNSRKGIIHYAAHPKPWLNSQVDLADLWWSYARQTPFYEEILARLIDFRIISSKISYKHLSERIFSLKNFTTPNNRYKILTIFGLKIKFKRKK